MTAFFDPGQTRIARPSRVDQSTDLELEIAATRIFVAGDPEKTAMGHLPAPPSSTITEEHLPIHQIASLEDATRAYEPSRDTINWTRHFCTPAVIRCARYFLLLFVGGLALFVSPGTGKKFPLLKTALSSISISGTFAVIPSASSLPSNQDISASKAVDMLLDGRLNEAAAAYQNLLRRTPDEPAIRLAAKLLSRQKEGSP